MLAFNLLYRPAVNRGIIAPETLSENPNPEAAKALGPLAPDEAVFQRLLEDHLRAFEPLSSELKGYRARSTG
jgi:hypothetical protein